MPTWRLLAILLAAAPFGGLGGPWVLLALAIALAAIVAATVDWLLASDGARLHIGRRLASDKLSLGAWNPVEVSIDNRTGRTQRIELRDSPAKSAT